MGDIALYIHIPFCQSKCAYCDFASVPGREADCARYLSALEGEIIARSREYERPTVTSIFIGGGTPSILPSGHIMHLIAMTRALFGLTDDAEITVEANPGTLTASKLADYRDAGVNRLSIGMQSASDRLLKSLGRIHTHADTVEAVERAQAAGFKNISLDLMYALPGQSMADWVDTLKAAMALRPAHLSAYSLILEPGTPMKRAVDAREIAAPDEEVALQMQHAAQRILLRRGYRRYEISNYTLAGYECRHNMVYWTRGDYLGVGCAAHSLMNGERFANTSDLDDYLAGTRVTESTAIDEAAAREEAIMLGTRTSRGIDLSLVSGNEGAVEALKSHGLIEIGGGRLTLTDRGLDVHNAVVLKLIGG